MTWFRVEERLPPPSHDPDNDYGYMVRSDNVLVFADDEIRLAYYVYHHEPAEREWDCWTLCGKDLVELKRVTHWRPLPEKP